ncbi:MAG: hypothetical protein WC761_02120 [Candidatus Paceibacterota bacterium]|jgi:hypothetical protein
MPYRTKTEIQTVVEYTHGAYMQAKRRMQKYFLRTKEDQNFAARFNRAIEKDKWEYYIAEKACSSWPERERRVAYGLAEDTPALKFHTRWILRAALRRVRIVNGW